MVCKDKDINFLDINTPQTFLQASTIPFYTYCSLLIQKFKSGAQSDFFFFQWVVSYLFIFLPSWFTACIILIHKIMWFIFELLHNFVKKVVYNAKSHDVLQ